MENLLLATVSFEPWKVPIHFNAGVIIFHPHVRVVGSCRTVGRAPDS